MHRAPPPYSIPLSRLTAEIDLTPIEQDYESAYVENVDDVEIPDDKPEVPQRGNRTAWGGQLLAVTFEDVIAEADSTLLLEMRAKRRPGPKRFFQSVKESVDKGIPLVWCVIIMPGEF